MKKLILLIMLLFTVVAFSQEKPFTRKYNYSILENDTKYKNIDLTVVFNYKGSKDIIFYLPGKEILMYRISDVTKGITTGGYEYQVFDCINREGGEKVTLQLFDENVLRVFMNDDYVEYHQE
jgi:hypothetical protein